MNSTSSLQNERISLESARSRRYKGVSTEELAGIIPPLNAHQSQATGAQPRDGIRNRYKGVLADALEPYPTRGGLF